jgi:hypothetical protein
MVLPWFLPVCPAVLFSILEFIVSKRVPFSACSVKPPLSAKPRPSSRSEVYGHPHSYWTSCDWEKDMTRSRIWRYEDMLFDSASNHRDVLSEAIQPADTRGLIPSYSNIFLKGHPSRVSLWLYKQKTLFTFWYHWTSRGPFQAWGVQGHTFLLGLQNTSPLSNGSEASPQTHCQLFLGRLKFFHSWSVAVL